jgi:hypothetical protein
LCFLGAYEKKTPNGYLEEISDENKWNLDLAEQCIRNSKIAHTKFTLSNVSSFLTIAGLCTPIGCIILILVLRSDAIDNA